MKRSDQKIENTWRLEDIFESLEDYKKEVEEINQLLEKLEGYQGKLDQGHQLYHMFQDYEVLSKLFSRVYVYANQLNHQDTGNAESQKLCGECDLLAMKVNMTCSYIDPEILSIDEKRLEEIRKQDDFKEYDRSLDMILKSKAHILSKEMEALLAKVSDITSTSDNVYSMFNNADIRFNDVKDKDNVIHPLTHGTYIKYMESDDRKLRKHAFKEMYRVYKQFNNTLSSNYYGMLKCSDFFSKERHYKNTLEAELESNEIDLNVYDQLIHSIHDHMDAMYKYVDLRKKALGLDELHMYDVYASLSNMPSKKYSIDEGKALCLKALAPLGEDYLEIVKEGFNNRWIDVYENEGKRSGAYSWGCYGTHPYMLLNYTDTLNDVFTLIHEMGHSMHTYYSNTHQNVFNSEYRIFVAEVASTCNEALLIHYLMNHTEDKEEKKYLINYFLDQFKGTMYRQTMFGEFEKAVHLKVSNGEMLTGNDFNQIYYDLNKLYFGDGMVLDEEIQYEWSRIPHFYTPFYVYQYATSFAAAISISTKILNGEEGIVEKYKQFLSSGCSDTPINLLKICDVDMSKQDPIDQALDVFEEYVNKLEELLEEE